MKLTQNRFTRLRLVNFLSESRRSVSFGSSSVFFFFFLSIAACRCYFELFIGAEMYRNGWIKL